MSAGEFGSVVGGAFASLLLPVLILIVARFVDPMKRHPGIVYSVCAVLVLLACAFAASTQEFWGPNIGSATLALLILGWSYTRDRNAAQSTTKTAG